MESSKPVMVVGATGLLGTEICRLLRKTNWKVQGLIRTTSDPAKVKTLRNLGVQTVLGDIKDRVSLNMAFKDAAAIITTASSTLSRSDGDSIDTVDRMGQLNVVDAASDAGIHQVVYISFLPSAEIFPLQNAKREVEKRIRESDMNYTILRPTFFMDVWWSPFLGFDIFQNKAVIYGQGIQKISWIAVKDVAAFAVASLDQEAAINSVLDVGGPEALSPLDIVSMVEEINGVPFQLQYVSEDFLRSEMKRTDDPLHKSLRALMLTYAAGAEIKMRTVTQQYQIELTPAKKYIQGILHLDAAPA